MLENVNPPMGSRDEGANTPENYLSRAIAAREAGDARLALHLFLAAFEQSAEASEVPSEDAIGGLKQAWSMACSTKERALAEYIFERLEPYLTNDEAEACAAQLQGLAFDRLAEFGISRDDLEELSEAFSGDMAGMMMAPPMMLPRPAGPTADAADESSDVQPIEIFTYDSIAGYGSVVETFSAITLTVPTFFPVSFSLRTSGCVPPM